MSTQYRNLAIIVTILFVTVVSIVKLHNRPMDDKKTTKSIKEIEFNDAKIIEVDTKEQKSTTTADTIYKTRDTFVLHTIRFINRFQDILEAKEALQKGDAIDFYHDVEFKRTGGFSYHTSHALYNSKNDTLTITKHFKALRQGDSFLGESMVYYGNQNYIDAKRIDSVLSLEKK
ncbi:MAG: hypothetical protein KU38_00950 [Sulfurovum sp. FS08-3]|nr:MAG: hypothetical protein KU38_00950 [Sulfurovum sp. FS08-3]